MHEPLVLVTRMDEFSEMDVSANIYERAAVYSALCAIRQEFERSKLSSDHVLMDHVRASCFHISAAIGYGFAPSKTPDQCLAKARERLFLGEAHYQC
jgi:hypothetical protein